MPVSEPSWWYGRRGAWQAVLLSPIAALYGTIAKRRILTETAYRSRLPVICIGNFTAGGSGKTPLALLVARLVADEGREVWFLTRGYGGSLKGPVRVVTAEHSARDVGDEPLLLARAFPTVVARDRRAGAEVIEQYAPANAVIIMDDGLQNPSLSKNLSIAVVDAARGFGNGRVIPAGPLRAPLSVQGPLVQLIVLMGSDPSVQGPVLRSSPELAAIRAIAGETRPNESAARFRGRKVVAFAGIANPNRFFDALQRLGAVIVAKRVFADHHDFSETEAQALLSDAAQAGATLVTTEKDFVRLPASGSGSRVELRKSSETLSIATVIESDGLDVLRAALRRAFGS